MKTGRPTTQTALIVHNGKTQLALDVSKGKRRMLTTEDGELIQVVSNTRPKKVNVNQGELFA